MLSQRSIGAAGISPLPSEDEFNRVSFLSHFDGTNNGTNNVFDDSSTSNHTITANGDVTQGSFGPFARPDGEWAVSFDGSSDSLTFTNDAGMSLDGDYTFELWFNASTIVLDTQHPNMIIIGTTQLFINSTSKFVSLYDSGADIVKSADNAVDENEWYHVAAVRSGSGSNNTSLYLNGTRVAQATNTATLGASSGTGRIGSYSGTGGDFNGHISNIRLVKGTALYSGASITVPSSPLTAVTNTKLLTCQSNRFVDNSTSAHTITVSGNPAVSAFGPFLTSSVYDAGVNGASAYFDGSGDWLVASSGSTDFGFGTDDFTMEFWINPNTVGSQTVLSMLTSASDTAPHIYLENTLRFYDGGGDRITSSTIAVGQWYHVAVCRSSSSTKMFINGVQAGSTYSDSNNYGTSKPCVVGSYYSSGSVVTGSTTNSIISDVRIVKGTAVYTSAFTPPTAPLTAVTNTKLLLNMADGQAIDSAAQNNLTLYGDAKISSTQAKFGGTSLALDGTGDYATLPPNSLDLGAGNFTLESWVYTTVTGQRCVVGAVRNSDGSGSYMLNINYTGAQVRFFCRYNGGTVLNYTVGSGDFPTNAWTHLAATRDGASLRVFINGTQVGTTNTTLGSFAIDNASLNGNIYYIGRTTDGANEFTGFLDDFRVSKTARYTANFTPPTEPFADKGQ